MYKRQQLEDFAEDVKSQGTAVLAADGYGAVDLQELSEYTAARRAGVEASEMCIRDRRCTWGTLALSGHSRSLAPAESLLSDKAVGSRQSAQNISRRIYTVKPRLLHS